MFSFRFFQLYKESVVMMFRVNIQSVMIFVFIIFPTLKILDEMQFNQIFPEECV